MVRGRKTSFNIRLTPQERQTLLAWQRATTVSAGLARRARIILLLAHGVPITDIAMTVGMSRRHVYKWIHRFVQESLEGCTRNDDMIAGVPRCRLTCGSNPHMERGEMCHAQHACVWYHARAHRGLRGGAGFPHPWGDRLGMRDTGGPARPHLEHRGAEEHPVDSAEDPSAARGAHDLHIHDNLVREGEAHGRGKVLLPNNPTHNDHGHPPQSVGVPWCRILGQRFRSDPFTHGKHRVTHAF